MSNQYSTHEQWLINQELSSLDKHLKIPSEKIQEFLTDLLTPGYCKETENFNICFYEEDSENRFSIEVSLIYVATKDEGMKKEIQDFVDQKNKASRTPYFTSPITNNNLFSLLNYEYKHFEILQYQKILLNHLERMLKEKKIENLSLQVVIKGPKLYRVEEHNGNTEEYNYDDNEDLNFDESMTDLLVHPFAKLPRMRVSNEGKILSVKNYIISADETRQELFNNIQQELKNIKIVQGDKILFTIDEEIIELFERWIADRQTPETISENINQLYPLLTSIHFLTQLQEWTELGKKIVTETELLNSQIQHLTEISTFDVQTIELLVKNAWIVEGKEVLTREELLDRWVEFLQKRGDKRSHGYIKKNVLRPRLKTVIEKVRNANELETFRIEIYKEDTEKSGKPSTLFRWKENDKT